jgi:tetratricopeptide (TPR) repeat protein
MTVPASFKVIAKRPSLIAALMACAGLAAGASAAGAQTRMPVLPELPSQPPQPRGGVIKPAEPPITAPKPATPQREASPSQPALPQGERLYLRLKEAKTEQEAKGVAGLIVRRWSRSGSDTVDLLATRMKKAAGDNNLNLAIELADRIIALEPNWAEGWHQRATLFFRLEDSTRAMFDLAEALKREPRHFVALSGLATLLQQQGKDKAALRAYREVLAIYPLMEGAKQAAEKLAPNVDGRDA